MAEMKAVPPAAAAADDGTAEFERQLGRVRAAQKAFSTFTQEKVDSIFKAAALAANRARIPLAKMAVSETGMGIVEDKVIKNHYAAEYIYNAYKSVKTCGVIERDEAAGIEKIAEPIGVIGAVIPTTNPTSTAIFKTLLALKTRNGIVISPHPRAKNCTMAAAKAVLDAAVEAGAPREPHELLAVAMQAAHFAPFADADRPRPNARRAQKQHNEFAHGVALRKRVNQNLTKR